MHWPARCSGDNFLTILAARGSRRIGVGVEARVEALDGVGVGLAEYDLGVSGGVGDTVTAVDGGSSGWAPCETHPASGMLKPAAMIVRRLMVRSIS